MNQKDLIDMITSGTIEEKVTLLKKIGILNEDGTLTEKYKSGLELTRALDLDEEI